MGTRAYREEPEDEGEDIIDTTSRALTGEPGHEVRIPIIYLMMAVALVSPFPQLAFIGLVLLALNTAAGR